MSFGDILHNLLIEPLKLVFEFIYSTAYRVLGTNALAAIVVLSLAVNLIVYPLYKRADELQEAQKKKEKELEPWIAHIRKHFKGDEKYMMLQALYRENNYSPLSVLNGSVSLLLQIPFFMAAYQFLSNCPPLQNYSFGPFKDLGKPDAMLTVFGFAINVLPVLMTLINLASSYVYTKGQPFKSRIQLYLVAIFFLVFLYDSPSGLVFYWLLNNAFSLLKNIFKKINNKPLAIAVTCSLLAIGAAVFGLFIHPLATSRRRMALILLCVVMQLPAVIYLLKKRGVEFKKPYVENDDKVFVVSCIFNAVLVGFLIPSALVASSPNEFVNMQEIINPVRYIFNALSIAAGLFIIWFFIFYFLAEKEKRWIYTLVTVILSVAFFVNYMFFGRNLGVILASLVFENEFSYTAAQKLINLLVMGVVAVVLTFIFVKKKSALYYLMLTAAGAMCVMSANNCINITKAVSKLEPVAYVDDDSEIFSFSKQGTNVMVIMMDRMLSNNLPYIFEERPELKDKLDGFTFYTDTVSYGAYTNFGTPGLYGGYEYVPEEMNRNTSRSLADKHDEALKVLPKLFSDNGYKVVITDPPYAGYNTSIADLTIFNDIPDTSAYITTGMYNPDKKVSEEHIWQRNMFCYGLFKVVPLAFQDLIYDGGQYHEYRYSDFGTVQRISDPYHSEGIKSQFTDTYEVLTHLTALTEITNDDQDNLIMFTNITTHEPMMLQLPDYTVSATVDNSAYKDIKHIVDGKQLKMETVEQNVHYQANMAALIQLGNWFDYLRSQGVYDNTRIIIVSDHGRELAQVDSIVDIEGKDMQHVLATLMVKDFNSKGFNVSDEFMTNADVPYLATLDVIENPVNPYTGNKLSISTKENGANILFSDEYSVDVNNGNTFMPGKWFNVKGNIYDPASWTYLGEH